MTSVAFLGLGVMGRGMAAQLIGAGFPVTVWNRGTDAAALLARIGAVVAGSARKAAEGADVVVCMVADDDASEAAWLGETGALAGMSPGAVLIESSAVSPPWIDRLAAAAAGRGCALLDAPVTGSRTHAEGGELLFLVGGDAGALEQARPIFAAMGRDAVHVGPTGSGARLKLVNNFLCGVQAASLAEAMVFIERSGLNRDVSLDVLRNGAPGSPLVKAASARMVERDYTVNFKLSLMGKDLGYAMDEAAAHDVTLEMGAVARKVFERAEQAGQGDKDFSAVVEGLR